MWKKLKMEGHLTTISTQNAKVFGLIYLSLSIAVIFISCSYCVGGGSQTKSDYFLAITTVFLGVCGSASIARARLAHWEDESQLELRPILLAKDWASTGTLAISGSVGHLEVNPPGLLPARRLARN
jgi:hypothetical protein